MHRTGTLSDFVSHPSAHEKLRMRALIDELREKQKRHAYDTAPFWMQHLSNKVLRSWLDSLEFELERKPDEYFNRLRVNQLVKNLEEINRLMS